MTTTFRERELAGSTAQAATLPFTERRGLALSRAAPVLDR